ncbi:hypothetical protein IQ457_07215 [Psychrobacter sp. M9-54-1]|uniref:hypothetical protein n=1 Tax=Psychrobacter sp. M9-54-1 TaxID=2782386 RepID=UPI001909E69B|nr:hypothetical protein [Psychrobacter sp. M9-54-1]MBK3393729.1 hypothetical protein [Psychrobacter sp. M9-54-1]
MMTTRHMQRASISEGFSLVAVPTASGYLYGMCCPWLNQTGIKKPIKLMTGFFELG